MARREKELAGGLVRKPKNQGNNKRGGKEGRGLHDAPADIRKRNKVEMEKRSRCEEPKVPSNSKPKPVTKKSAPMEVKRYIEGGVHALLALPKDTKEVFAVVPDRNGNKAEFRAVGGGFNTGKLDEETEQPIFVEFVEISLISAEVGNALHSLPESASKVFITQSQVRAAELNRKPSWTDDIFKIRLALREYLREAMTYSAPAPIFVSQFTRSEREVPAILKPTPIVEPKLVPESQMEQLQALRHQLSEEALRKDASRNITAFMAGDLGKYVFGGVYVELKMAGRDIRVTLLCVDEGTSMHEELGAFRNIGFSFAQLQGSAELPLIFREGTEPRQVAVRTFHAKLQKFLKMYGFKIHNSAEEPKVNGNETSDEPSLLSIDEVRREEVGTFEFEGVSLKTAKVQGMRGAVAAVFVTAVPEDHEAQEDLQLLVGKKMYIPVYLAEKFKEYPREKMKGKKEEELDALEALFKLLRRAFKFEVAQPQARNLLAGGSSQKVEVTATI